VLDASGGAQDGTVVINSPESNLERQVAPLPIEFADAAAMLVATCSARSRAEGAGSFRVSQWRGLPLSPDEPLVAFGDVDAGASALAARRPELPVVSSAAPRPALSPTTELALSEARVAFRGGRHREAARRWLDASEAAPDQDAVRADALRGVAQARQASGEYEGALAPLYDSLEIARRRGDLARVSRALGQIGNARLALRQTEEARAALDQALATARSLTAPGLVAALLNNRANLDASERRWGAALSGYRESAELATEAGSRLGQVRAIANAARAAIELDRPDEALEFLDRAREGVRELRDHEAIALAIHIGGSYLRLASEADGEPRARVMLGAHSVLTAAIGRATALGDARSASEAVGLLGRVYSLDVGGSQDALYLARRAQALAREAEALDLLARWHSQAGQVLWGLGDTEAALAEFRRAAVIVEEIRPEARALYGSASAAFHGTVEPAYLNLVDALLQTSDALDDPAEKSARLAEARASVERWRVAELRDYFSDPCVAEIEAAARPADTLSARSAVVYPVVLPDRLELLVSTSSGTISRHVVAVPRSVLEHEAARFRLALAAPATDRFLTPAQRLYDWLVAPYQRLLAETGVETIVFVPDGALRTIPLAALHDGRRFLIERWAVAVTPSLDLIAPRPLELSQGRLLLGGLSEPVQGFEALENVPDELAAIEARFDARVLLDDAFRADRFEREIRESPPSVVHLASHAEFTGDPRTSFVLTHDGRLTLEDLSGLVGEQRFGDDRLELLVLSACETAVGDERAALGLAGVAVRAGASSALGTLWPVSDAATRELIVKFYDGLAEGNQTKAGALRAAQLALLGSEDYAHPFYWAPFLMINNWL
jgi:CHAT domain-containing protein